MTHPTPITQIEQKFEATEPDTTPDARHERPGIDAYRIGWNTYWTRFHLPWQAEIVFARCTCNAARGLTRDRAKARMLRAHTRAVEAGRCPA